MIVYPARDIRPFVTYCVNGKPRSSLLIESTDSMISVGLAQARPNYRYCSFPVYVCVCACGCACACACVCVRVRVRVRMRMCVCVYTLKTF